LLCVLIQEPLSMDVLRDYVVSACARAFVRVHLCV